MIKGTTKSGFKFQIDPADVNDMEYIEVLADLEDDITKLPRALVMALGKEQKKALYEHARNSDGKVPVDVVMAEFEEILTIANEDEEAKNS